MISLYRLIVLFAISLLLAATPLPSKPDPFELAGYIVGLSDSPSNVYIVRGLAEIPVTRPMPIAVGDKIVISNRARVVLQTNQSRRQFEITARDSPYRVEGPPKPPSGIQDFINSMLGQNSDRKNSFSNPPAKQNYSESKGVSHCSSAASHILPLERAPALGSVEQDVWGARPYFLAWSNGQAPFSVRLRDGSPAGRLLVDRICENGVAVSASPFTGSTATLEVSDASGKVVTWNLRLIAEPPLVRPLPTGISSVMAELARGLDALDRSDGRTRVMGLSILSGIEAENFIAWRLLFAVRDGDAI